LTEKSVSFLFEITIESNSVTKEQFNNMNSLEECTEIWQVS